MRKRIYEIIEIANDDDKLSALYDMFMMIVICASIILLCFKEQNNYLNIIDKVTVTIFVIDYLLRWFTADFKLSRVNEVPGANEPDINKI